MQIRMTFARALHRFRLARKRFSGSRNQVDYYRQARQLAKKGFHNAACMTARMAVETGLRRVAEKSKEWKRFAATSATPPGLGEIINFLYRFVGLISKSESRRLEQFSRVASRFCHRAIINTFTAERVIKMAFGLRPWVDQLIQRSPAYPAAVKMTPSIGNGEIALEELKAMRAKLLRILEDWMIDFFGKHFKDIGMSWHAWTLNRLAELKIPSTESIRLMKRLMDSHIILSASKFEQARGVVNYFAAMDCRKAVAL